MTIPEIQERLNALSVAMAAKALVVPHAAFSIKSHTRSEVLLSWGRAGSSYASQYKFFYGPAPVSFLDAETWVAALPSPEQTRMTDFVEALAKAIEAGKAAHVEVEQINPLIGLMKRLTKNALEHHP